MEQIDVIDLINQLATISVIELSQLLETAGSVAQMRALFVAGNLYEAVTGDRSPK